MNSQTRRRQLPHGVRLVAHAATTRVVGHDHRAWLQAMAYTVPCLVGILPLAFFGWLVATRATLAGILLAILAMALSRLALRFRVTLTVDGVLAERLCLGFPWHRLRLHNAVFAVIDDTNPFEAFLWEQRCCMVAEAGTPQLDSEDQAAGWIPLGPWHVAHELASVLSAERVRVAANTTKAAAPVVAAPARTDELALRLQSALERARRRPGPDLSQVATAVVDAWNDWEFRRYHDRKHLLECLQRFDEVRPLIDLGADNGGDMTDGQRECAVLLALFYHDVVYRPGLGDAEERSAQLLQLHAEALNLDPQVTELAVQLVRKTAHHKRSADTTLSAMEALVVDIDLAILGVAPDRFAEYQDEIRQEFRAVPDALFDEHRARFLASCLASPSIYQTPAMAERYEAQARQNLRSALAAQPVERAHEPG